MKKLMKARTKKTPKKKETSKEKVDREERQLKRKAPGKHEWQATHDREPKAARVGNDDGRRRRTSGHTNIKPQPKDMEGGARGRGRGRERVTPAWVTMRPGVRMGLHPIENGDQDDGHEIERQEKNIQATGRQEQQDDDARATTDDDDGGTRRDDTKADNTEGDNDEGKAGRGLELELEVELDLELGRGHLQSHEKATTIGTVPTPSPTRGDTVVLTVPKAAAKPSKGEHRQRGPANGGYGSDSNDNMRLESRPASEAAVTSVVRPSKTEPPEETRQGRTGDARGGCAATRATNSTQGKAGNIGGKTVLDGATGGDRDGRTGVTRGGCADKGPSKSPTTKKRRKSKTGDQRREAKNRKKQKTKR